MKERLTITLDEELLKKVDATIDGVNVRNRSHAIEKLIDVVLSQHAPKRAVIFAGGHSSIVQDSRRTITPMIKIQGKPVLDYILNELKRNGIREILLTIGKESDELVEHFGDGSNFGVRISYIREDAPKGTEGALSLVKGLIGTAPFFALNGDHIFRLDMNEMYAQHVNNKAATTMALTTTNRNEGIGVAKLEGPRITSFIERPSYDVAGKLVNAGIYIFDPSIFSMLHASKERVMLERSLFPKLAGMGKLYGYVFSTPWYSISSTGDINKSIKELEKFAVEVRA